jgi:hypothetical protein
MQTFTSLRATCILMFAALCLGACASGPPQDGPGGDWGRAPRPRPPGEGEAGGPPRQVHPQLFISPAGEPFRAEPGAPYPVAVWFAGADADHDGALSRDEFVADALRFFDKLDVDHNGVIDGFEVSTYETKVAPEILQGFQGDGGGPGQGGPSGGGRRGGRGGPPGGGGGGGPPGGGLGFAGQDDGPPDGGDTPRRRRGAPLGGMLQGATPYSLLAEPQPVMASDGDFDRRITRAEAAKAAKSRFALLDTDGDGRLQLATLPKTPLQARLERASGEGRPPRR